MQAILFQPERFFGEGQGASKAWLRNGPVLTGHFKCPFWFGSDGFQRAAEVRRIKTCHASGNRITFCCRGSKMITRDYDRLLIVSQETR